MLEKVTKFIKSAFYIILILGPSMYFGINKMPTEMGIAVVASALVLAFINMEKFEFFKGAGFEAKLREVEKATDEAYATIETLKEVSLPIITEVLRSMNYSNRFNDTYVNLKGKMETNDKLDEVVKLLNLDYEPLKREQDDFYRLHTWDLYNKLIYIISKDIDKDKNTKLNDILNNRRNTKNYVFENEFEEILETKYSELNERYLEDFKNYIYFAKNKKIRTE